MNSQRLQLEYQGDAKAMIDYGFDSAKFDGCGPHTDLLYYQQLLTNSQGKKPVLIENCHWGKSLGSQLPQPSVSTGGVEMQYECPYHFARFFVSLK